MEKEILEVLNKYYECIDGDRITGIYSTDFKQLAKELDALFAKRIVSRSNAIDYAEGFELAMDFIDKHSADPDITDEQLKAWIKLQSFVNKVDCKK